MSDTQNSFIRPLSPGELAQLYDVSIRTLKNWLRPHENKVGPRTSKYYTVLQVRLIYTCIGSPSDTFNEQ